ncbi:phage head closure protein [Pseudobacillus badius]|uniref:phage head closure protein n=1 Tax=Bacillus badius TaxID=1455 RepID=UPI0024A593F5|nr:phage head closure protein [Bacillus badius]GLY09596.1 hypothetical protein Bbad01_08120 [Bacillus badius]
MSRWADIIHFMTIQQVRDEEGFNVEKEVPGPPVFANKKSVRSSEFYQAAQNGVQLEVMFEVRTADYIEENRALMHNDKHYTVERTYEKTDIIELVCKRFDGAVI